MKARVLLIEDDDAMRASLAQSLEIEDIVVVQANSLAQARRAIRSNFPGVVLSDIRMPREDGFAVLDRVRAIDEELPVIFLTGEADVPMAVRALHNGVYDFLEKPCSVEALVRVVRRALSHRKAILQARRLESILENSDVAALHFPGTTAASRQLRKELRQLAELSVHVHIIGEPGVGKRLAAHTLHFLSDNDAAAVSINFGRQQVGALSIVEESAGKYCILKNIELCDPAELRRVAESISTQSAARIVTTSTAAPSDLPGWPALSEDSEPAALIVPSLLQRSADLPVIFESLVRQAARNLDTDMPDIPQQTFAEIAGRAWRGNLPELRKRARDIVLNIQEPGHTTEGLADQVQGFEKWLLIDALKRHNGQAALAARFLKLPRKTIYDKLAKYGIEPKALKSGE